MIDVDVNFVRGEVDDLLARESGLSEWEIEFIESVSRQLESGPLPLSDRQVSKLHQIWDKMCE